MSIMTMLIAFLITLGVALMFALLIVCISSQENRHRTKSQLLGGMLVPPYMRRPDGGLSSRFGKLGLGEWVNEEIERGKHVYRPHGSRIRRMKSQKH
jgi:hypothetical protein